MILVLVGWWGRGDGCGRLVRDVDVGGWWVGLGVRREEFLRDLQRCGGRVGSGLVLWRCGGMLVSGRGFVGWVWEMELT